MGDAPRIDRLPKSPIEAARDFDASFKADAGGNSNLSVWAVFIRRDTGEAAVVTTITDPALMRAILIEAAGHVQPLSIVAPPSLILPHA